MKTTSVKTTTTQTFHEFTQLEVLNALMAAGKLPHREGDMSIEAYIRVPGGGDWSNRHLDLLEAPLQVKVVVETREES